jgi:hypothetical protein
MFDRVSRKRPVSRSKSKKVLQLKGIKSESQKEVILSEAARWIKNNPEVD